MEREMKGKMARLCGLLVLGLVLAGVGSSLGAEEVFRGEAEVLETRLVDDRIVMSRNHQVVDTLSLPEGKEGVSLEIQNGAIHIGYLTKEEIQERQAEHEVQLDGWLKIWLKIAEEDSKFRDVVAGKKYKIVASGESFGGGEERMGFLVLEGLEGGAEYYKVTLDLSNETVESIEEQDSGAGIIYIYREG